MSHIGTTWAWAQDLGTPVRKLMLLHMADSANPDSGNVSFYSRSNIAKRCNCSKSTVSANLKWLESEGYITLIRKGNKDGNTNKYRVNVGDVVIQNGPKIPIPADDHPIPGDGHPIPGDGHPIPGDGPITVINRKSTVKKRGKPLAVPSPDQEKMVIDAYHKILPELPRVSSFGWCDSETRENLRQVWKKDAKCQMPGFWITFFEAVRDKEFWMTGANGKPIENARLAWLLTPSKYKAVITKALEIEEKSHVA